MIDARRREVFVPGPRAVAPDDLELEPGTLCIGSGAVRYRPHARGQGRGRAGRRRPASRPHARLHAALAREFGPAEDVQPIYVRAPDAKARARHDAGPAAPRRDDLDTVETIERASYPTPWSRSMFAAELRKPSALALGAYLESGELVGYAFVSRYVDAWHVMNVAVAPEHRRRGIATELLERLFEVTANDQRRGYTLEVRVSNGDAIRLYERLGFESRGIRRGYYTDNREDALIMWRKPFPLPRKRQEAGAGDASPRLIMLILGVETSCDETAAARRVSDGRVLSSVVSLAGRRCTRASAASSPRWRRGATSSW